MAAFRTPAGPALLVIGEAHDTGLLSLLYQIVYLLTSCRIPTGSSAGCDGVRHPDCQRIWTEFNDTGSTLRPYGCLCGAALAQNRPGHSHCWRLRWPGVSV
ncbi:hypothetical protein KZZ20_05590 [Methylacidiphilum fumariolicum]|uniref:hypothetical protein n=1 Tax=Candidatus Methylacidiphilum fumarolicum TaxID=591154 RepID=UPI00106B12FF|nr:hypothetical protein [Candidatus Methylacidiphilum fumarolicum]MBW6414984.1 hypothetical protein [Candidatus Methylacidiphilum fumarolicum]